MTVRPSKKEIIDPMHVCMSGEIYIENDIASHAMGLEASDCNQFLDASRFFCRLTQHYSGKGMRLVPPLPFPSSGESGYFSIRHHSIPAHHHRHNLRIAHPSPPHRQNPPPPPHTEPSHPTPISNQTQQHQPKDT